MRAAGQVRALYFVLLGVQILTSLAGIALLQRMSPAIGEILRRNEASVGDADRMLAELASPLPAREAFYAALVEAEANISEPEEGPLLDRIRARAEEALDGQPEARRVVVADLRALSDANRRAMREADAAARRLGLAGRWALTLLGLLGILASAVALRRARQTVLVPVAEMVSVLEARRLGDHHRRYVEARPSELSRVFVEVNAMIDQLERPARVRVEGGTDLKSALAYLLDRVGEPVAVVDAEGEVVALSSAALDVVATRGGRIGDELRQGAHPREAMGASGLSLVRLDTP